MKIYYKSKIAKLFTFIDGYKTIMLFGAVFTERDSISLKAEYHEESHCNQYHTMFCFGMFISLLTIGLCLLFGNADEDVDCITSATESSIYHNDSFYIFV